jgi:hypothetical protein
MEEIFKRNRVQENVISEDLKTEISEKKENVQDSVQPEQIINKYDWANISAKQAEDIRNKTEEIEKVETEFKKDIGNALKF